MFEQSLSYSDFHISSDCEICLFVLDLETTYMTHFPDVPTVSKSQAPKIKIRDSFTWSEFPQGYSLDFIKAFFQSTNKLSQVCLELEITPDY